jgi:hypothetical protein
MIRPTLAVLVLACVTMQAPRGPSTTKPVIVTPDNFNRAETDTIYANGVKSHGLGNFEHHREPIALDFPIVRPNRDTL